eukprot:7799630-Alexandrium_andersonii.AAC.1
MPVQAAPRATHSAVPPAPGAPAERGNELSRHEFAQCPTKEHAREPKRLALPAYVIHADGFTSDHVPARHPPKHSEKQMRTRRHS